jgi:uncharacterized protein YjeT (DUF2065 family)
MKLFLTVIGMMMIMEGIPYFAFPEKMKYMLKQIQEMNPGTLRFLGFLAMLAGLLICYLAQRTDIFS